MACLASEEIKSVQLSPRVDSLAAYGPLFRVPHLAVQPLPWVLPILAPPTGPATELQFNNFS